VTTLLLDTHVLAWWAIESRELSPKAARAIARADELAVAGITWYELAWLVRHERIDLSRPLDSWLEDLSSQVRTVGLTPAIAVTAASLDGTLSGDPIDRLIVATAIEHGLTLVTKDERMRTYEYPRLAVVW
jgi:PIN domain nuclease of toxin-antitoxin system